MATILDFQNMLLSFRLLQCSRSCLSQKVWCLIPTKLLKELSLCTFSLISFKVRHHHGIIKILETPHGYQYFANSLKAPFSKLYSALLVLSSLLSWGDNLYFSLLDVQNLWLHCSSTLATVWDLKLAVLSSMLQMSWPLRWVLSSRWWPNKINLSFWCSQIWSAFFRTYIWLDISQKMPQRYWTYWSSHWHNHVVTRKK